MYARSVKISLLISLLFSFNLNANYPLLIGEIEPTPASCIPLVSSNSTQFEQLDQVDLTVLQEASEPHKLQEIANFVLSRVPNWRELSKQALFTAAVEVSLGDYIDSIKNDESAKAFIRDVGLVPSLLLNVLSGEQVAGLKYVYDYNHLLAHGSKIVLKVGGALVLINLTGKTPAEAFKLSGYAGDIAGRLFVEKSRFEQDHPNDPEAFCWSSGLFGAITQIVPTNLVMYQVNNFFNNKLGLVRGAQKVAGHLLNGIPQSAAVDVSKTYSQNMNILHQNNRLKTSLIVAGKLVTAMASAKALNTMILSPLGNTILDGIKKATKMFHDFFWPPVQSPE